MATRTMFLVLIVCHVFLVDSFSASPSRSTNGDISRKIKKPKIYDNFRTCVETSKCEKLSPAKCFGSPLKYTHTAVGKFVPTSEAEWGAASQDEAHEKLKKWAKHLKPFPACWKKVQPFLCAMYLPPCVNDTVQVPMLSLCDEINDACAIIEKTLGWPGFLHCYNERGDGHRFPSSCTNSITRVKFNTSSQCVAPLTSAVSDSDSWYEETECGLQCRDPLFTKAEIDRVSVFIFVLAVLCLMTTGFTIFTFIIDWKKANFYPPLVLFYLNLSFFVGTWGWMAQFFPGSKNDIVCREDATIRHSEPKNETQSCLVVFFIIYYSFLSGLIWFVILSFCWYLNYQKGRGDLAKLREYLRGKTAYFHLVAWSVPLVLCIIISGMSKLDGDFLSGVCFMGYRRRGSSGLWMPIFFVLVPMVLASVTSGFFIFRGVRVLLFIRRTPTGTNPNKAPVVPRISPVMTRMGVFFSFALLIIATSFACHVYVFVNQAAWEQALRGYVVCRAGVHGDDDTALSSPGDKCFQRLSARPNVSIMQLHIFCYFAAGMLMSLWVWNARSLATWKSFFRRLRRCGKKTGGGVVDGGAESGRDGKLPETSSRRRQETGVALNPGELMPFTGVGEAGSATDDPIGMGWELNSLTTASQISSSWTAAIPNIILRRGGGSGTLGAKADSSTSFSDGLAAAGRQRRLSIDSHASGSQAAAAVLNRGTRRTAHAMRKRRMRQPPLNDLASTFKRRNSDTSASSLAIGAGLQGHALHPLRKSLSNSQNSLFQETSFMGAHALGSARSLFTRSASELNSGVESDRNSIARVPSTAATKRAPFRHRKESGTSKGAETENESIAGGPWGLNGFPGFSPQMPFMNDPYWASQLGGGGGIPGYPYAGGMLNPFPGMFPPPNVNDQAMNAAAAAFGMGLPFGGANTAQMAAISAMMRMTGMASPMFPPSSFGDSAYAASLNPPRRQISGHIPGRGSSVSEAVMAQQAEISGSDNEWSTGKKSGVGKPSGGVSSHRQSRSANRGANDGTRERGATGGATGGATAAVPPMGFTSIADVVAFQMAMQAREAAGAASASHAAAPATDNPLANMTVCSMQQNVNLDSNVPVPQNLPSMITFNLQHYQKLFSLGSSPASPTPQPLSTANLNTMNMSQAQQIAAAQQQMHAAAQQHFHMMAVQQQMMMAAATAAHQHQQQQQRQNKPGGSSRAAGGGGGSGPVPGFHSSTPSKVLDPNANVKNGSDIMTVAKRKGPEKGSFRRSHSRQSRPPNASFESIATE